MVRSPSNIDPSQCIVLGNQWVVRLGAEIKNSLEKMKKSLKKMVQVIKTEGQN